MQRNTRSILIATSIIGAAALMTGCPNNTGNSSQAPATADLSTELGVQVPSQEEADAAAAKAIDESNADEEFENLQQEIDGGQ